MKLAMIDTLYIWNELASQQILIQFTSFELSQGSAMGILFIEN